MNAISNNKKGELFEAEVFQFFKGYILSGEYIIKPEQCTFFVQKGYYSHDRGGDIKFDMAVEIRRSPEASYSFLLIVECKNLSRPVSVDDIEEFNSKLIQIAGRNVKGIVFTKKGYAKGALNYAGSKGIALARLLPDNQVDWVMERASVAVDNKTRDEAVKNEVAVALTAENYIGKSEPLYGFWNDCYYTSFTQLLAALVPIECKLPPKIIGRVKGSDILSRYVPYVDREHLEGRVSGILEYFRAKLLDGRQVLLLPVCEYLTKNNGVEFIFDQNLGKNSQGLSTLGKIDQNLRKIYVSNELEINSPRWRFTLAHEIGHFLLHRKLNRVGFGSGYVETNETLSWNVSNRGPSYRLEWQANAFASCLLLPKESVAQVVMEGIKELGINNIGHGIIYLDEQRENIQAYQQLLSKLKQEFNVSYKAINYRLVQLDILNNQMSQRHVSGVVKNIPLLNSEKY